MKRLSVILVSAVISGCVSAPQDLDAQRSTQKLTISYTENYQEIYRRVATTARRCVAGGIGFSLGASFAVDADLYPDLGYGEIQMSLVNVGTRNYYWTARVEKAANGSTLRISSGNTLRNSAWLNKVRAWADGDTSC